MAKYEYEYLDVLNCDINKKKAELSEGLRGVLMISYEDPTDFFLDKKIEQIFSTDGIFQSTLMLIWEPKTKELIGYASAQIFDRTYDGRRYGILYPSLHFHPKLRGENITSLFLMKQVLKFNLKKIGQNISVISYAEAASPAPYYGASKHFREIFPNRNADQVSKLPKEYQNLFLSLREEFSMVYCKETENVFVCKAFKINNNVSSWRAREEEAVRFYLDINDKFDQGYCMLMINSCNLSDILYALRSELKESSLKLLGIKKANKRAKKGNVSQSPN